ncbi:MAG TPA: YwiC-like family protein [Terriglobales bacterium]|nr:YwiC-like family protein [Terriglobales bacterium]
MSAVSGINDVRPSRTKALVIPREHGAWGILLVPLVTAACVGFLHGSGLVEFIQFLTAALALFWLRTPLEVLLGSGTLHAHTAEEKRTVWQATLIISSFAALPLYLLFRNGQHLGLLFIGAIAGAAFATQACVKLYGRKMRMPAQMIGAIGLTSTAAGAYYVVTGRLDSLAFALWAANWLFACDQIHFVQLRLRNSKVAGRLNRFSRGWAFLVLQVVMLVLIASLSLSSYLPLYVVVAFMPIVARGIAWIFQKPEVLDVQWLGLTELLHAITFGVLLITSFYVPR